MTERINQVSEEKELCEYCIYYQNSQCTLPKKCSYVDIPDEHNDVN